MPISLPDSPTDGQTVQLGTIVYTYDATAGVWNSASATGPTLTPSTVHTSDTAPSNPNDGDMWFDSSIGKTFIWYNDGTSSQWIQMNPNTGGAGGGANLGSVSESIIPDTDITYDLGSSSKKFKDLYLSGNTLNLGNQSINATSTGIVVSEIQIGSGTNNVKLSTNASGNLITTETDSSGNSGGASPAGGAATIVADMAGLIALTGMSAGSQAYVTANNKLYFYTGSGWYLIATVQNDAPSAITGVDGSYALATDGTTTTITAVSTDPEGFALTWSYTASGLGSIATVSQADNVFTVTPSTDAANAGSFTLTISATDGINGAVSTVPSFSLQFSVTNSRYTALSVKATATGSNQTFDDASTSNHTITAAGDVTASTFSPYRHGGYSLGLDGTNDYITIPQTTDTDLTGDFTVEMWVYFNQLKNQGLIGKWSGSGLFGWTLYNTGTSLVFASSSGSGAGTSTNFTQTPAINEWLHIAISRTSGTISTYINGTRTNTNAASENCTANTTLTIGSDGSSLSAWSFDGYMRDVRIVNGTGLYTGTSITVPTEPLTAVTNTKFLLGDLPYFKDQSASNHTITVGGNASVKPKSVYDNAPYSEASHGASAYFDGTGDYLTGPTPATIGIGTGDFTIECWFYATDATTDKGVWDTHTNSSNSDGLTLTRITATTFRVWHTSQILVSSATAITDHWNHLAVVRNSGTLELFVNGVSQGTVSNSANLNSAQGILIGGGRYSGTTSPTTFVKGYIQDFRVTTSAVYTSAFTPPTAPLTAITNTKFLLNPETSISDLSQSSTIKCVGDAATDTTQVKFAGTKSIYLDSTGDYISIKPILEFGEKNWTFETWVYVTSTGYTHHLFSRGPGNSTSVAALTINANGIPSVQLWDGSADRIISSGSAGDITANTWHHVVLTHTYTSASNSTYKIWVDGSEVTSITHTGGYHWSWSSLSGTNLLLGAYGYNHGQTAEKYLQDSRLTIGPLRYTSTFTPPTAELQG